MTRLPHFPKAGKGNFGVRKRRFRPTRAREGIL